MKKIRSLHCAQGDDETMNRKAASTLLRGVLAALMLSVVFAGSAGASPVWKFEEEALEGTEAIVGGAEDSGMTIPGLTTSCENFLYGVDILNKSGTGEGEVNEVPLYDCYTSSKYCTVDAISAEGLPWPSNLTTVSSTNYIVIEEVDVDILYGGELCALGEMTVTVTGSAGGSIDNTTESATFSAATLSATETELTAFEQPIEWKGLFPTEAFEWHREEKLSVS
jgi:hypothetical protein